VSAAILVALISGLVAVASVVLSSYATIRTTRTQHELELRRHKLDRSDAVEEIMSKYRDPLLRSAIDLQGRVYSIVRLDFMQRHLGSGDPEQIMYAKRQARSSGSLNISAGWRSCVGAFSSLIWVIRLAVAR
jgi:hypothetical protein